MFELLAKSLQIVKFVFTENTSEDRVLILPPTFSPCAKNMCTNWKRHITRMQSSFAAPWGGSIISCQFVSFLLCHSWASAAAAACKTPLCKLRLLRRSMALIALKSINAFYAFREFLLFALEYWTTLKKAAEIVQVPNQGIFRYYQRANFSRLVKFLLDGKALLKHFRV